MSTEEFEKKFILNRWIDNHKFATRHGSHSEDILEQKISHLQRQEVNRHSSLQPWTAKNIQ